MEDDGGSGIRGGPPGEVTTVLTAAVKAEVWRDERWVWR